MSSAELVEVLMRTLKTNMNWDSIDTGDIESVLNDPRGACREFVRFLGGFSVSEAAGEYLIDLDKKPSSNVWSHKKGGIFAWDPYRVRLLGKPDQEVEKVCIWVIRKRLQGNFLLNSNVCRYLMDHQELIPEEWKGKRVFFLGTVFGEYSPYNSCKDVWGVNWGKAGWDAHLYCLSCDEWGTDDRAAVIV